MARAATARAAAPARRPAPRRGAPARSSPARGHASTRPRAATHGRVAGATPAGGAVALPVRVFRAPFTRAARATTGRLLDALLSGRGWIALVFVLLAGIVFFNVDLLQMNREIARNADKIAALERENARLLGDKARLASSERIQEAAAELGLVLPAPGEVRYLKARPGDDGPLAAKRITTPNTAFVAPEPIYTSPEPIYTEPEPIYTEPAEPATDPAYTDPAATTTAAPAG